MDLKLILFVAVLIIAASLMLLILHFNKKKEEQVLNKYIDKSDFAVKSKWNEKFNTFAQKLYSPLLRIPLLKSLVLLIRRRIETLSVYDEYSLRRQVIKVISLIFSCILLIVFFLLIFQPGYLFAFWIMVGAVFISGIIIDVFVNRVEIRLLNQIKNFNNDIRFFYPQTKMVDEAIQEAMLLCGPEMKVQAEKIYEILTSVDPEAELAKYEEVAPTRFLKIVAGLAQMVKEEGDVVTESGSAFLNCLTAVNVELNAEILYRNKLKFALAGLSTITVVPVFLTLPLKNWATTNFPIMAGFYDSRIGFLAEILIYASVIIGYFLIRKLSNVSESKYLASVDKVRWEKQVLDKAPFLKPILLLFKPRRYSVREFKLERLIKDANVPITIDMLALQRFLVTILTLVILLTGLFYSHYRSEQNALYGTTTTDLFAGPNNAESQLVMSQDSEFDRRLLQDIENQKINPKEDVVKKMVMVAKDTKNPNDEEVQVATERILNKISVINNAYTKWYELIVVVTLTIAASFLPNGILIYMRVLRKKEMENEVFQYLILIGILKEFEGMSVLKLLGWLDRFSIIFKKPIQKAILNYDSGAETALEELKETVVFPNFHQVIERLQLSVIRISIKEAFEDIHVERDYYVEQRKEMNERTILTKSNMGTFFAYTPLVLLITLFLVVPMVYMSTVSQADLLNHLNK